jgi:hypothetical protein
VAVLVAWFVVAVLVGWSGLLVWLSARGGLQLRAGLRLAAWTGVVGLPLFVAYVAARGELSVGGCVFAFVVWAAFAAVLWRLRRPPARRDGEAGGTSTLS